MVDRETGIAPDVRPHTHTTHSPAARGRGLGWFYRILDVEYGVEMAVRDAARIRSPQAATFSLIINGLLMLAFAGVWLRYDLWSTITVFAPIKENILTVVPEGWALVRTVAGFLLGLAAAFFTSLIQWSYPRFAQEHDAALWGLAAASLFDIATDYPDVKLDFPTYAAGMLETMAKQDAAMWGWALLACAVAGLFLGSYRGFLWGLALICGACLIWPVVMVWTFVIVFVGTIFASFVAQSLMVIHVAKCVALLGARRQLAGV